MTLTDLGIKKLIPRDKIYRVVDSNNLVLEVTPSGSKLWRWKYKYLGKHQMMALGKYPQISLAQARKMRDQAREKLKKGLHPGREKKIERLRASKDGDNTFEIVARQWHDQYYKDKSKRYRKQVLGRMEKHIFPAIGSIPINDIIVPDIVKMLDLAIEKGVLDIAKRMRQHVIKVFNYAAQRGICSFNPGLQLTDVVPTNKTNHHACIHPNELNNLLKAIANYRGKKIVKLAVQLLALTFVRTTELIAAEWSEIDFKKNEWSIPALRMKKNRNHIVPLSSQAMSVLGELQKINGHRQFIFYSAASQSKHISNGSILRALDKMGYTNKMTGHGFRTLASTILNEKGYSRDAIEVQLSHVDKDKVRSAYNRAEYMKERKKIMRVYGTILDKML